MLGETNPRDSKPGTIRGDFCIDVGRNICHGSDSVESATKEIQMWFGTDDLAAWRPVAIPWTYEGYIMIRNVPFQRNKNFAIQHCKLASFLYNDSLPLLQDLFEWQSFCNIKYNLKQYNYGYL